MPNPCVSVVNLGCRVNRVESDRMTSELLARGFELVDEPHADLVIINTCAVTGEAEAKTRKAVRRALNQERRPLVIATGCVVNLNPGELTSLSARVIAEPSKLRVPQRACEALGVASPRGASAGASHVEAAAALLGRSRAGVKIQDGCNHRCSYCIVWKARGPERSVAVEEVLAQVRRAVDAGMAEVVLTGVNLGAYRGLDGDGRTVGIAGLLDAILSRTAVPQVRLSSIEPMDVDPQLVACMASNRDRVAPFLHLPIQSGCTSTLRRMARPYGAEGLLRIVDGIRRELPEVALSCDVIVGFPGETDAEFCESLDLCERVGFSRMHVFRYSKRPGTPAASMPDQVPPEVMAERSERMRNLAARMAAVDAERRIGTHERAVVEYPGRGTLGSFHRIILDDYGEAPVGSLVNVAIMNIDDAGLLHGAPVPDEAS